MGTLEFVSNLIFRCIASLISIIIPPNRLNMNFYREITMKMQRYRTKRSERCDSIYSRHCTANYSTI